MLNDRMQEPEEAACTEIHRYFSWNYFETFQMTSVPNRSIVR